MGSTNSGCSCMPPRARLILPRQAREAAAPSPPPKYCLAMAGQLQSASSAEKHEELGPQSPHQTPSAPLHLSSCVYGALASLGVSATFCQVGTWHLALPASLCDSERTDEQDSGVRGCCARCQLRGPGRQPQTTPLLTLAFQGTHPSV